MNQPTGHGLIIEAPAVGRDYVAGGYTKLSGEVINPDGDWLPFAPKFEHQAPQFETSACASEGTTNAFEILHKFLFGEELNLSARMIAKGSGTDPLRGNTPQKVAEWFRKNWSVFEEFWPTEGVKTIEDYYQPLPPHLYIDASKIKGKNLFGYEAITNPTKLALKEALTKGTVCMSVSLIADDTGLYYKPLGWSDSHWVTLLNIRPNGNYTILDSYPPFIKEVRSDFVPQIAYRYALNEAAVDGIINGLRNLVKKLLAFINSQPAPIVEKPRSRITEWALAIQHAEGGKPGDRNIRDHNPGNIKYTPYTASLGALPADKAPDGGYYARFPTYEIGLRALCTFLKEACEDKLKAYKGYMTLEAFTKVYANVPAGHGYIKTVAQRLGVSKDIPIRQLL